MLTQDDSEMSDFEDHSVQVYEDGKLPEEPKLSDFVLVEFGQGIHYVAKIMSQKDKDGDYEVLRKSTKMNDTFIFPNVEDLATVKYMSVRAVLPPPVQGSIKRHSSFKFPVAWGLCSLSCVANWNRSFW